MSQSESNANAPVTDSTAAMLQMARETTARIITAALEATAEAAELEHLAHERTASMFPAMASLPAPLSVDPKRIAAFTESPEYRQLLEKYTAGRLEGHLLTQALELLRRWLPAMFAK